MSAAVNAAAVIFDPHLSAFLQNEILRRGWEGLATGLPYEESTVIWWDIHGLECNTTGVTSRLTPPLIEFLKQARAVRPNLQVPINRKLFYYVSDMARPKSLFPDQRTLVLDPEGARCRPLRHPVPCHFVTEPPSRHRVRRPCHIHPS